MAICAIACYVWYLVVNGDNSGQQVKVDMQNQGPSIEEAWGVSSKYVPNSSAAPGNRGGMSGGGGFSVGKPSSSGGGGPPPVPHDALPPKQSASEIQGRLDQGELCTCTYL